jgi:hypothetical protein
LEAIEKGAPDLRHALGWRPGPGRAHIAWQAMHLAATHDRYLNVLLKGGVPEDDQLVKDFAGGSTPSDTKVPTLGEIRKKLDANLAALRAFAATAGDEKELEKIRKSILG